MNVLFTQPGREVDLRSCFLILHVVHIAGPTYVWAFKLRSKKKPAKWVLAGVALLLQI